VIKEIAVESDIAKRKISKSEFLKKLILKEFYLMNGSLHTKEKQNYLRN
jgi:hypothetical protein